MTKKSVFLFILCSSPLLPAFSRFSYGLVFAIDFCLLFLALLGARRSFPLCALKKEWVFAVEIVALLLVSELYAALVKLILPIEAFALDFFICLAPFAYFLFDSLLSKCSKAEDAMLIPVLTAVAYPTALSLFRELAYFGAISFPAVGGAFLVQLIPQKALAFTRFFGSLPGSLIALGLLLWLMDALASNEKKPRSKAPLSSAEDSSPK